MPRNRHMKIVVLVKMVPDVGELKFDPGRKTLIREGVRNLMNSFDRRAVEEAVKLKEETGAETVALSMGPPPAEEVLRDALAMGVDKAVLLSDRAFAGSDTLATSYALSMAAKKLAFDVVIGGKYSLDAETGQVIPEVAELLEASLVTDVSKREYLGKGRFRLVREFEGGTEELEARLPLVVSVGEKINKPRTATKEQKARAVDLPLAKWTAADLDHDLGRFGLSGSPTVVKSVYDAAYSRTPLIFEAGKGLQEAVDSALKAVEESLARKRATQAPSTSPTSVGGDAWSVLLDGEDEVRTGREVLSKLRMMGLQATAVIANSSVEPDVAVRSGARKVIDLQLPVSSRSSLPIAYGIAKAIESLKPYAIFFPSTVRGREVAGRVAARLRLGLTGDCTGLRLDDDGNLIQVKPAFGGNIMAEILSKTSPQAATVRPGVFDLLSFGDGSAGGIVRMTIADAQDEGVLLLMRNLSIDPSLGDLYRARAVISAGFGVGSREGFEELRTTASQMGFALAATRKIVDLGWAPPQLQVGLTGKSISPELYVAVGLSGATNHVIGIRRAKAVLAINKDQFAPVFKACDVGIIGDYGDVLPLVKDRLARIAEGLNRSQSGHPLESLGPASI